MVHIYCFLLSVLVNFIFLNIIICTSFWKIEANIFAGCTSLTSIILPTKLQWIQHDAFLNCSKLRETKLPKYVEKVDQNAFQGCNELFSPSSSKHVVGSSDGNSRSSNSCGGGGSTSYTKDFDTNSIQFSCDLVRGGARYLMREEGSEDDDKINDDDDDQDGRMKQKEILRIDYPASLWPSILYRINNEMHLPAGDIFGENVITTNDNDNNNRSDNDNDDDENNTDGKVDDDMNVMDVYTNIPSVRRASVVYYMMIHGIVMDMQG